MYMILCECWDDPEGDPGQSCVHLFAGILSTFFSSFSIFSVCCYSSVSISMLGPDLDRTQDPSVSYRLQDDTLRRGRPLYSVQAKALEKGHDHCGRA
jgi:hypothetical protein